jgi:hypothetical protein
VTKAESFDNQALWDAGTEMKPDDALDDPARYSTRDTAIKAEGASSARFDRVAPGNWTRAGGWYQIDMGGRFGEGDTFYVQWQERFNDAYLSQSPNWWNQLGSQPKFATMWSDNGSSCQDTEISFGYFYASGITAGYTHCGLYGIYTTLDRSASTQSTPLLVQQGTNDTDGYNCSYADYAAYNHGWNNGSRCHFLTPNHWITFYLKVHIGTWNVANSEISMWISEDGGPYQRIINSQHQVLEMDNVGEKFANIYLMQYVTNPGSVANLPTLSNWIDSVIISTQPIAVPKKEN